MHFYSGEGFYLIDVKSESAVDSVISIEIIHTDGSTPAPVDWTIGRDAYSKIAILDVSVVQRGSADG